MSPSSPGLVGTTHARRGKIAHTGNHASKPMMADIITAPSCLIPDNPLLLPNPVGLLCSILPHPLAPGHRRFPGSSSCVRGEYRPPLT